MVRVRWKDLFIMRRGAIVFSVSIAAALVASCSGGQIARDPIGSDSGVSRQQTLVPARTSGWISKEATSGAPLIYVSARDCECVRLYTQDSGTLVGLIVSGLTNVGGIATDNVGDLWVPNGQPNFYILMYAPGSVEPSRQLNTNEEPIGVVVADDGTVYVSNSSPTPAIYVYADGATDPTYMLFETKALFGDGIGLDKHGNLYWAYQANDDSTHVDEFVQGKGKPIDTGISLQPGSSGSALTFSDGDKLVLSSPGEGIDVFSLPNTHVRQFDRGGTPNGVGFNRFGRLFVANSHDEIQVFNFVSGTLHRTYTTPSNFTPDGLALYPRAPITY
jgi:hypothetical protein